MPVESLSNIAGVASLADIVGPAQPAHQRQLPQGTLADIPGQVWKAITDPFNPDGRKVIDLGFGIKMGPPQPGSENERMQQAVRGVAKASPLAFMNPSLVDNPGPTIAAAALPATLQGAARYGGPALQAAAVKTGQVLSHPAVGGTVGAIEGARQGAKQDGVIGGVTGALIGGGLGAAGSTRAGAYLKRIVPKVPIPPEPPRLIEGMGAIGRTRAENLAASSRMIEGMGQRPPMPEPPTLIEGMSEIGRSKTQDMAASARMIEGMRRATPPPGSKLRSGSPRPTIEQSLTQVVDELRLPQKVNLQTSHPVGGGFTTPPDVPIPTDKTFKRLAPFAKTARARYRELSMKGILTPVEAQEMAYLKPIVEGQAKEVGASYAAGGR